MEWEGEEMLDSRIKSYIKLLLKKEICSVKFIVLILFMITLCGMVYYGLPSYLANSIECIGFWEIFACFLGSQNTKLFYMTGVVYLLGGIPYSGNDISLYIIRGNKEQWVTANLLTIVIETLIYYISLALINVCMCIQGITFRNEWTALFKNMQGSELGEKIYSWLDIYVDASRFGKIEPMVLCLIIVIVAVLSSIILGLIIFLCSMCQNRRVGIIFCFVLIIGGLFDSGLKGLGWYQYVQNINVVSYANQYWSGIESILGQSIYMKGTVIVFFTVGLIRWIYKLIKQKDWVVEI